MSANLIQLTRSELLEVAHRYAMLCGDLTRPELARRINEAGGTAPYRAGALEALDAAVGATRSEPPAMSYDSLGEAWISRYGEYGEGGWDDPHLSPSDDKGKPRLRVVT